MPGVLSPGFVTSSPIVRWMRLVQPESGKLVGLKSKLTLHSLPRVGMVCSRLPFLGENSCREEKTVSKVPECKELEVRVVGKI